MAKHTEKQWAEIIINNWSVFGKTKITKKDILTNPSILAFLNLDDLVMSSSRNEEVFKQQIGNIVSHKNGLFDFFKISGSTYFSPKSSTKRITATETIEFDDQLLRSISDANIPVDKVLELLRKRPQISPKVKLRQQARFESSTSLKQLMKVIRSHTCELGCDMKESSFLVEGVPYTEAHHMVPMNLQGMFSKNDIDAPNNIIILCPKHHREIHYGNDKSRLAIIDKMFKLHPEIFTLLKLNPKKLLSLY